MNVCSKVDGDSGFMHEIFYCSEIFHYIHIAGFCLVNDDGFILSMTIFCA